MKKFLLSSLVSIGLLLTAYSAKAGVGVVIGVPVYTPPVYYYPPPPPPPVVYVPATPPPAVVYTPAPVVVAPEPPPVVVCPPRVVIGIGPIWFGHPHYGWHHGWRR